MEMKLCFVFDEYGEFLGLGDSNFYCIDKYNHFDNFHDACEFYVKCHTSKEKENEISMIFDEIQKKLYEM